MSTYTPNYNIPQYESEDKPNLRDQYNAAMDVIDTQLKKESDDVVVAIATANNAKEAADKAQESVDELTPKVEQNTTDIATNTADIATNKENIATNTADIATNTADIATLQSTTEQHTGEIDDMMGDIARLDVDTAGAGADIETINNKLATYGTAATKNFETTLAPTGANLPTSKAVADYVSGLTPDVGEWKLVAQGNSSIGTGGNQISVPILAYANESTHTVNIVTNSISTFSIGAAADADGTVAFTMPETYRPSYLTGNSIGGAGDTLLKTGLSTAVYINRIGEVHASYSCSKALNSVGFLNISFVYHY